MLLPTVINLAKSVVVLLNGQTSARAACQRIQSPGRFASALHSPEPVVKVPTACMCNIDQLGSVTVSL